MPLIWKTPTCMMLLSVAPAGVHHHLERVLTGYPEVVRQLVLFVISNTGQHVPHMTERERQLPDRYIFGAENRTIELV